MTRSLLKPSGSQAYPMTQKKLCKPWKLPFVQESLDLFRWRMETDPAETVGVNLNAVDKAKGPIDINGIDIQAYDK